AAGMERPVRLPRGTRPRARHYYEGFVEKRGPGDQVGDTAGTDPGTPGTERQERPSGVPGDPGTAPGTPGHCPSPGPPAVLPMKSWEMQEMWRGFILTMAKVGMPPDLALLPGHISQLLEALREEQQRRGTSVVPSCFFQVTRAEAELLLELSAPGGNLLLRPGGHGQGVSVTTRQEQSGRAVLKHYRVKREPQGYLIDLETPVSDTGQGGAGAGDRDPNPGHPPEPPGWDPWGHPRDWHRVGYASPGLGTPRVAPRGGGPPRAGAQGTGTPKRRDREPLRFGIPGNWDPQRAAAKGVGPPRGARGGGQGMGGTRGVPE
uniref:STAP2 protein n=1 Tax=Junco hyemalis TaxID=40217 RepID=A0A8C5ITP5_JUNHY